jgi:hypothetical protein
MRDSDWITAAGPRGRSSNSSCGKGGGAHLASYPIGSGGSSSREEADQLPPSSADIKNKWTYTSTSPYTFMTLLNKISTRTASCFFSFDYRPVLASFSTDDLRSGM